MAVVENSHLEREFGPYLEYNESNMLNLINMPFLDLGDKPKSYNPRKTESE